MGDRQTGALTGAFPRRFHRRRESHGEAATGFEVQFLDQFIAAFVEPQTCQSSGGGQALQQQKIVSTNDIQQDVFAVALRFGFLTPGGRKKGGVIGQAIQTWPILAFISRLSTGTRGHEKLDD